MGKGKVYILKNDAMEGILKIGITEQTIEERMKTLDNTSVPLPFRFYYAIESERYKEIEKHLHDAFSDYRVRENREFFKIDAERVVSALKIANCMEIKMGDEMIDEEGEIIINEKKTIKVNRKLSFSFLKIPIGTELSFTRDDNKKCIVVSDNEVEFQNERYSLSRLADKFLRELGYNWKSVQGPTFFEYNGKTLYEIRNEIIGENNEDIIAEK